MESWIKVNYYAFAVMVISFLLPALGLLLLVFVGAIQFITILYLYYRSNRFSTVLENLIQIHLYGSITTLLSLYLLLAYEGDFDFVIVTMTFSIALSLFFIIICYLIEKELNSEIKARSNDK